MMNNAKSYTLFLRAEERAALDEMARQQKRPCSVTLRRLIREAARARGLLPPQASAASSSSQRTQPVATPNTAESAEEAGVSRLDEIEARWKASAPGTWEVVSGIQGFGKRARSYCSIWHQGGMRVATMDANGFKIEEDAALIAHAPTDIAYLLRIARAAQIFVCIPNSDHDEELRDNAEDDLREALL